MSPACARVFPANDRADVKLAHTDMIAFPSMHSLCYLSFNWSYDTAAAAATAAQIALIYHNQDILLLAAVTHGTDPIHVVFVI